MLFTARECIILRNAKAARVTRNWKWQLRFASRHHSFTCELRAAFKASPRIPVYYADLQRSTSFFSLMAVHRRARRDANCSLQSRSYELVVKLNFCALNSFGIIISRGIRAPFSFSSSSRVLLPRVWKRIMAKFDVYEFLTFNVIYKAM